MSSLEKIIETQPKTIEMIANELTLLREQVEYLRQKLYGKSSEKVVHQPGQLSFLGEESLPEEAQLTYPVETETITYKRKKAKEVRQAIFSQFTPEIVHHELQGGDCTCPVCHGQFKEIGSTVQRQELVFIPAQLKRIDHIQHAYKCQACSQKNLSDKIIKAPVPKAPLAHSLSSASIIAHTIHQKFNLKVPNYR